MDHPECKLNLQNFRKGQNNYDIKDETLDYYIESKAYQITFDIEKQNSNS